MKVGGGQGNIQEDERAGTEPMETEERASEWRQDGWPSEAPVELTPDPPVEASAPPDWASAATSSRQADSDASRTQAPAAPRPGRSNRWPRKGEGAQCEEHQKPSEDVRHRPNPLNTV